MHTRIALRALFLVPALVAPIIAWAQSMTVISSNQHAQSCYTAATFAAQMHIAGNDDVKTCTMALEIDPLTRRDRMATLVNRGVIYVALNEVSKATRDYEAALALEPRSGEVYVNRGNLYFVGNLYDKAIDEYNQALSLGLSKDHIAYFNRAMAYEHLGNTASAEQDYLRAIDLSPQWAIPQAKLDAMRRKARTAPGPQ